MYRIRAVIKIKKSLENYFKTWINFLKFRTLCEVLEEPSPENFQEVTVFLSHRQFKTRLSFEISKFII